VMTLDRVAYITRSLQVVSEDHAFENEESLVCLSIHPLQKGSARASIH
jgi:hypothetical protein